jgi:hypothetical protein
MREPHRSRPSTALPSSTRSALALALALAAAPLCACSGGGENAADSSAVDLPPSLALYGTACTTSEECATGLCVAGVCSKKCTRLLDCPSVGSQAFDCGEAETGLVACYPRKYASGKNATGYDCSMTGTCGSNKCMGQSGDADRFCSAKCSTDRDCPPKYRCGTVKDGTAASEKRCVRRAFCHPCAIDDQCGTGNLCLTDKYKNKFCGQACQNLPAPDTGGTEDAGPTSTCPKWATCVDTGKGKYQCEHKAGHCWKSFKSEAGLCEPCLAHGWSPVAGSTYFSVKTLAEDKICKSGAYCVLLDTYSREAVCVTPCTSATECPTSGYDCWSFKGALGASFCAPVVYDTTYSENVIDTCTK